jgi:hypothetical protein
MNSTMTISLDLQGSLLTARVRGYADELAEGSRIVDAVRAEALRVGADSAMVDFSDMGGAMAREYQLELEQYAGARMGRVKCALVLPADCVVDGQPPAASARFAVFGATDSAVDWLQARQPARAMAAPARRPEHTLVHLL